jgi:hypothetical protein
MRDGAAGPTVGKSPQEATMRRHRRVVASALAAAFSLIVVPPTFAASGVFGGSTSAGEAIVLKTDAKAKKLRSAVIAWRAPCSDDRHFPMAVELTPVADEPGFTAGPEDLVMSKNAKGRFTGTEVAIFRLSDTQSAVAEVKLKGKLRPARSSGTLTATVTILDATTPMEAVTCETGTLKWSASRAAGRIYGGTTSQDHPVVVRLDAKRKRVADLLIGWETSSCEPPDHHLAVGDELSNFEIRSGRFGDIFDASYPLDGGGQLAYAYDVAGSVSRRTVRGTLRVTLTRTDATGATDLTCDTGAVDWRASTG